MRWRGQATVEVTVRWDVETDPEFHEGLLGRTPEDLARYAAWVGGSYDLSRVDGWADFKGGARLDEPYVVDCTNEETP